MNALLSRAMNLRIGGVDAKFALVALCHHARLDEGVFHAGRLAADALDAAFKASEMTRQQFQGALRILRDRNLIGVVTKQDLAGRREIVEVTINLAGAAANDASVEIVGEQTPTSIMWSEALRYFRDVGTPEHKARPLIGRLLKAAKGDPFAVTQAIQSARRAQPHDPFTWLTAAITRTGGNNGAGIAGALDRLSTRVASGEPAGQGR